MSFDRRRFLQSMPLTLAGLGGLAAQGRPAIEGRHRARDLGIRIGQLPPGAWNAITDVPGVRVGHSTIIRGEGPLRVGAGPVRTGVTAIWPHAAITEEYLPAGFAVPNGNGEVTGLQQIRALGVIGSPICLTNTSSVGMVYDALLTHFPDDDLPLVEPIVGETWDAYLNDVEGRHVRAEHVREALTGADSGPVVEGCVGGGTGMICYDFKGGIGSASRRLPPPLAAWTVGALVQANHGDRAELRIDGVPVGEAIDDLVPRVGNPEGQNSILMILATDAPLLAHQLDRVARRAVHGLAKTGSISHNGSGDFALAFSTANRLPRERFWQGGEVELRTVDQFSITPIFDAVAEAVEEAVINALFMATDMEGIEGRQVFALPLARTLEVMAAHHRLFPTGTVEVPPGT